MNKIEEQLIEMLTENTGTHFLDSGGDNGRHWQENQGHDFLNEPEVSPHFYDGKLEHVTVSLFHYLKQVLDFDWVSDRVNREIEDRREEARRANDWDGFPHWVGECDEIVGDLYDQGELMELNWHGEQWNTYNGEQNISQTLTGRFFTVGNDDAYVLLQIHQGADVRGGYTKAHCFKVTGLLTGFVDVDCCVSDQCYDTRYNGYSFTDESGNDAKILEKDNPEFSFYVCD